MPSDDDDDDDDEDEEDDEDDEDEDRPSVRSSSLCQDEVQTKFSIVTKGYTRI